MTMPERVQTIGKLVAELIIDVLNFPYSSDPDADSQLTDDIAWYHDQIEEYGEWG